MSCTRYNCPIHTGAVCDNLLIACQIQIYLDKLEILVPCYLCNAHAILDNVLAEVMVNFGPQNNILVENISQKIKQHETLDAVIPASTKPNKNYLQYFFLKK